MFHEISFPSFSGQDTIYGWIYEPIGEIRGIVQLVHGLGEHSRRYLHMILAMTDAGFVVACDDHIAHGKTAIENDNWTNWGDRGYTVMVEDEHTLHNFVKDRYPGLPMFFFGHSLGSMITRQYMMRYADDLSGVTICGTMGALDGPDVVAERLEKLVSEGHGHDTDYSFNRLEWMNERIPDAKFGNEWVCGDPYVQRDHRLDPFNSLTEPNDPQSMLYMQQMRAEISGLEWAKKVPKELPVYNIAGDQDPVGNYGEGVYQVSNWLAATGHEVSTKLYPGRRHEIHNYPDLREEVEQGILVFMNAHI